MAIYEFKCSNENCKNKDKLIVKNIPISEYSSENLPECEICKKNMQRIYTPIGCRSFEGYRS